MNANHAKVTKKFIFFISIEKQAKTSSGVPVLIHKCVMYLEDKIDQEGIYRISGVKSRYEGLKLKCNQVSNAGINCLIPQSLVQSPHKFNASDPSTSLI